MRKTINLNDSWLFSRICSEAPSVLPSGNGWQTVSLPHTWNAVDGQIGIPFERGAFWYVRSFDAPEQPIPGGRVYIEIGAAGQVGTIYVNGCYVNRHIGGYSAFRADITDFLKDGENILAIECDNRQSEKVYPQRADFTFYGGLYRYVRLLSVPNSRFTLDDHGSDGVYIDAWPSSRNAYVKVRAGLTNPQDRQTVRLEIIDPEERIVSEIWTAASECTEFSTILSEVRLWDGTNKSDVYRARLSLVSFNEVLDEIEVHFGIRSFLLDKEKGFILNNQVHTLRGVCRHQDRLYLGNALTPDMAWEDARLIAESGANCVRLAHYQQSHDMYEACDRLGLAVWAEIPYFATSWDDDAHAASVNEIKELVAQNYNHPSIFFWGLSNEILMQNNDNPKLLQCHRDLNEAVKSIDSRRITVIAHEYAAGWDHQLHDIPDAEGWNHYFGWYRGNTEDLAKWLDEYHAKYPDRMIAVSEYGCDGILSYHSDEPVKMDYSEEYQVKLHQEAMQVFSERPWVWGSFVWNMFDFGSFFRREGGTRGRNNKGLVTLDRKVKKDAFYVLKAWLSSDPFVHIDGRRYFARPYPKARIIVHSNLDKVTLYVDERVFGTLTGAHEFVFENVPLSPEGTVIRAVSGDASDRIVLHSVSEKLPCFTFPEFKRAQDARNWFESLEETAGSLVSKPGFYSIHDTLETIFSCDKAKDAVMSCILGSVERSVPETVLDEYDPSLTVAEALDQGRLGFFLKNVKEKVLRRMHTALSMISKTDSE